MRLRQNSSDNLKTKQFEKNPINEFETKRYRIRSCEFFLIKKR